MTAITLNSRKLGESFTFTMSTDGGYVRVNDGKGDYNQIFKSNGAAITAYSEDELRKVGKAYIRRCIEIENSRPPALGDYKLETADNGLYEYREDEFGQGFWMRVATYPPRLKSLTAVLNWLDEQEEDIYT